MTEEEAARRERAATDGPEQETSNTGSISRTVQAVNASLLKSHTGPADITYAALAYAERGLPIHPLQRPDAPRRTPREKPGKTPLLPGWQESATTDAATIRAWGAQFPGANWGAVLDASGLFIVAPDSPEWDAEFRRRGLPPTVVTLSGSGRGRHYWYRRPEGCPRYRHCVSGEYDLLTGGNLVLPPSLHPSGNRYGFDPAGKRFTGVADLPEAPAWAVAMHRAAFDRTKGWGDAPAAGPVVTLARPRADVRNLPPAGLWLGTADKRLWIGDEFKGDDRSGYLWRIAMMLAERGADDRTIAEALLERDLSLFGDEAKYSTRPDAMERYWTTARRASAAAEATGRRGTPGAGAEAAPPPEIPLLWDDEVEALPRPAYLIEGLLVRGTLAGLYGPSGGGKTFLALDLALCVATGDAWNDRAAARGTAVYIAAEGAPGLGPRIRAWKERRGVAGRAGMAVVPVPINLLEPGHRDALIARLRALPAPPALVIVDTLAWAMVGGDENSVKDVMKVLEAGRAIREAFGATVLFVHHTGKSGEAERGSSALRAACDTMLKLTAEGNAAVLAVDKQKDGPAEEPIHLRMETVVLPPPGGAESPDAFDPESIAMPETSLVLVAEERGLPGQLTASERKVLATLWESFPDTGAAATTWMKAGEHAEKTFYRARTTLKWAGLVELRDKRYHITEAGKAVLGVAGTKDGPSAPPSVTRGGG